VTSPRGKPKATLAAILVVAMLGGAWFAAIKLFGADDVRPGSPDVYSRIKAATDCKILQGEFNTAQANYKRDLTQGATDLAKVDTSYIDAATARMRDLGCTS
jgi:hypothetical protein